MKETLEEAISRIKSENEHYIDEVAFELGAKWQQERSYSEEEILNLLNNFSNRVGITDEEQKTLKWFEQFKKK